MSNLNKIIIIFAMLLLAGCDKEGWTYVRVETLNKHTDKRNQWALDCIKNGNPMSDEEGEDLVSECTYRARKFFPSTSSPGIRLVENSNARSIYHRPLSPKIPCKDITKDHPAKHICDKATQGITKESNEQSE